MTEYEQAKLDESIEPLVRCCGNCERWEPGRGNTGTCFARGVLFRTMTLKHMKCKRFKKQLRAQAEAEDEEYNQVTEHEQAKLDEAIGRLADMIPSGHLLAATDPVGFLNEVASQLKDLQAEVERIKLVEANRNE